MRWAVHCTRRRHYCNRNLTWCRYKSWVVITTGFFCRRCQFLLKYTGAPNLKEKRGAPLCLWCKPAWCRPEAVVRPGETLSCCNSCRVPPPPTSSSSGNTGWLGGAYTRSWGRAAQQWGAFTRVAPAAAPTMALCTRSKCTNSLKSILLKTLL